jgi:hypothetical protein
MTEDLRESVVECARLAAALQRRFATRLGQFWHTNYIND